MSDGANPSGATDLNGASARMQSLFNSEPEPPTEESKAITEDSQPVETPEEGDTPAEQLFDVKYGDTVEKLTLDQLIKGNMMEKNYRQGTMDNADMRRALEEKSGKFDQYLVDLEGLVNVEADHLGSAEMQELKEIDPDAYWSTFEKTKIKVDQLKTFQAKQKEDKAKKTKSDLAKESELTLKAIPEWLDSDKAKAEWQDLTVYLKGHDVEISTMTNHKNIILARKAMLFDNIQSKSIEDKKVNTPPKSTRPGASQDEAKPKEHKARDKLSKTGHVRDAQAALKELLFK